MFYGPAVHVVGVRVSTDPTVQPDETTLRTPVAGDGSTVALVGTAVEVQFDRYLDPRTAIRQSYCLRSDTTPVGALEDCVQGIGTAPVYDPVRRTLTLYLGEKLNADKLYTLTVFEPRVFEPDAITVGIRAFDGAPLAENFSISFRTEPAPDPAAELESLAPLDDCGDIGDTFRALTCHTCHEDQNSPQGLVLTEAMLPGTIGRVARETQTGANADEPAARPARFGTAMPIVDARNAGNSYVLYKMLALAPVDPDTLVAGETERLANTLVVGAPMPASGQIAEDWDVRLSHISRWISAGAACSGP